jgi:hypothetical protein
MMVYIREKSSKKFLNSKKHKKLLEQENEWLKSLDKISKPKLVSKKSLVKTKRPNLSFVPPGRETPNFPSKETPGGVATKPVHKLYYTGDKMKGIGTLHKSNAVPVFSEEEARDQATMRR